MKPMLLAGVVGAAVLVATILFGKILAVVFFSGANVGEAGATVGLVCGLGLAIPAGAYSFEYFKEAAAARNAARLKFLRDHQIDLD